MARVENFLEEHLHDFFHLFAVVAGLLVFAYKSTKKIDFVELAIGFVFCMVAWSALNSIIPESWHVAISLITFIFGFMSKSIVEFLLKLTILLGQKAEIYANQKLDDFIHDDSNNNK